MNSKLFIDSSKVTKRDSPKRGLNSWSFEGITINKNGLVGEENRKNLSLLADKNTNKRYGERIKFSDLYLVSLTPLGQGASSIVTKYKHLPSGKELAAKKISCFKTNEIISEIRSLTRLNTYNIIQMHDAFCHDGYVYLILEYMDCTLGNIISKFNHFSNVFPENILSAITYQLLKGLEELKSSDIVHRDLKPSNVLLNKNGKVAISDFGCAAQHEYGTTGLNIYKGTSRYMSPERLRGENYSFPADVWSLGIILTESVLQTIPFEEHSPVTPDDGAIFDFHTKITKEKIQLPSFCSPNLKDFIHKCLQVNPSLRPTPSQLLQHPWIIEHKNRDSRELIRQFMINQVSRPLNSCSNFT